MTIYLKDATFIDWDTLKFIQGHMEVVENETEPLRFIDSIPSKETRHRSDRVLNCKGKWVTKSFACGHHHIYSALARGMPPPHKIPDNFHETLKLIWWRLDRLLDLEMIKAGALVTALYCLKNGVTFLIDHHSSPFTIEHSLHTIATAFDEMGISHLLCYEMSDRDGKPSTEKGLEETDTYLSSGNAGHVGLHASFTVGDELLRQAVALAENHRTGIHVHVAEDPIDQNDCVDKYNKRVIHRFADAGVLDLKESILSHCIYLEEDEITLIRDAGIWIAQNTESNLNNNVGLADYKRRGKNVMLGTDGMHSDMLRSAKAVFLSGQPVEGIEMSETYNRFRNIHRYLNNFGFRGDGNNNLVILDYDAPTEMNSDNFLGHFIFGIEARHVDSVIASGKLVVKHKRVLTADEDDILLFSKEMAKKLWRKMM